MIQRPRILDVCDAMPFGIYKGMLVGSVIEENPDYMRRLIAVNKEIALNETANNYLKECLEND